MAIVLPFAPLQASASAGKTVKVTTNGGTSVPSTLTCDTNRRGSSIRITNAGTSAAGGAPGTGVVAFVRLSAEATPVATAADIPVAPGQTIVLPNPVPEGVCGIAVLSTGTTNVDLYFTPGEGGA